MITISSIILIFGLFGRNLAFPNSVQEFYEALHQQLTPVPQTRWDACEDIAGNKVLSYKEVIGCLNSFPLKESVRRETLDSLNKTLEFYVYKDIIEKSPDDNIPSSIKLDNEMRSISDYKFHTEFEFNSFLTGFFNTLHDGHTLYTSSCYSSFIFKQPFPMFMYESKIWVLNETDHSEYLMDEWLRLGVNVTKYYGSQVLRINDMEPLEYLKSYISFYWGTSRDINSRLSYGFARQTLRNGIFFLNHGLFTSTDLVPVESTVKYLLKTPSGETIDLEAPYLALNPKGFIDSETFYDRYCHPSEPTHGTSRSSFQRKLKHHTTELIDQPLRQSIHVDLPVIYESTILMAYKLGEDTGVLVIRDFSLRGFYTWSKAVKKAFDGFRDHNIKKLILELSDNMGGEIYRSYDILLGLFPDAKLPSYDMRSTELLRLLSQFDNNSEYSPIGHNNTDGVSYTNKDAFTEIHYYPRGNHNNSSFTPKFIDQFYSRLIHFPVTFHPKDIAIVTNFICYSACTLLVNSLQQLYNVTTYTTGTKITPLAPAGSMAGGGYMTSSELYSLLTDANLTHHPNSPSPLPSHVTFSFNYCEAYFNLPTDRPQEFTFLPADYHLIPNHKSLVYHPSTWEFIARKMGGKGLDGPETVLDKVL